MAFFNVFGKPGANANTVITGTATVVPSGYYTSNTVFVPMNGGYHIGGNGGAAGAIGGNGGAAGAAGGAGGAGVWGAGGGGWGPAAGGGPGNFTTYGTTVDLTLDKYTPVNEFHDKAYIGDEGYWHLKCVAKNLSPQSVSHGNWSTMWKTRHNNAVSALYVPAELALLLKKIQINDCAIVYVRRGLIREIVKNTTRNVRFT